MQNVFVFGFQFSRILTLLSLYCIIYGRPCNFYSYCNSWGYSGGICTQNPVYRVGLPCIKVGLRVEFISWAAARPGPPNFESMGCDPVRPINFSNHGPLPRPAQQLKGFIYLTSRSPTRPTKFRVDGPQPAPAHQIFKSWAATQPGPAAFQIMGGGPARPINFTDHGPRPGPAHHIFKTLAPARPGPAHHVFNIIGPARPGPVRTIGP